MKALINKIIAPFVVNGKPNLIAIIEAIICILVIVLNAIPGYGGAMSDFAQISLGQFNIFAMIALILMQWFRK